jgi:hypothetical protein
MTSARCVRSFHAETNVAAAVCWHFRVHRSVTLLLYKTSVGTNVKYASYNPDIGVYCSTQWFIPTMSQTVNVCINQIYVLKMLVWNSHHK